MLFRCYSAVKPPLNLRYSCATPALWRAFLCARINDIGKIGKIRIFPRYPLAMAGAPQPSKCHKCLSPYAHMKGGPQKPHFAQNPSLFLRFGRAISVLSPCDCGCHGKARYFWISGRFSSGLRYLSFQEETAPKRRYFPGGFSPFSCQYCQRSNRTSTELSGTT